KERKEGYLQEKQIDEVYNYLMLGNVLKFSKTINTYIVKVILSKYMNFNSFTITQFINLPPVNDDIMKKLDQEIPWLLNQKPASRTFTKFENGALWSRQMQLNNPTLFKQAVENVIRQGYTPAQF